MPELPPIESQLDQDLAVRVKNILRPLFRITIGLTADGLEHIPDEPPYIVGSTHSSNFDPFVEGVFLPDDVRMSFPAKVELYRIPLLGKQLPKLGAIPFDRSNPEAKEEMAKATVQTIQEGGVPIVFSEATRWHGPFIRPDLQDGVPTMSRRLKVPVLPVGIGGNDRVLRRKHNPRPKHVHVEFGEVLEPLENGSRKSREAYALEYRLSLQRLKSIANEKAGADFTKAKRPITNDAD